MIATSRQSASSTLMPAVREDLRHACSADARLAGSTRVHLHQFSPSFFRFVRELLKEGVPTRIVHGTRQHSAREPLDVKILNRDDAVAVHQQAADIVMKVPALIPDLPVCFGYQHTRLAAPVASALASGEPMVCPAQVRKTFLQVPGIINLRPIRENREAVQSNVNANCAGGFG